VGCSSSHVDGQFDCSGFLQVYSCFLEFFSAEASADFLSFVWLENLGFDVVHV
jgi:hypothetical protein